MKQIILSLALVLPYPVLANEVINFVAAPRGDEATETAIYKPIADYLSVRVSALTGTAVTFSYQYTDNWLMYRKCIKEDCAPFKFHGPHFVSWGMTFKQDAPLIALAGEHVFAVIVKKDKVRLNKLTDLAGQPSCLIDSPNLAAAMFIDSFPNAARLPHVISRANWKASFEGISSGACVAAVLPDVLYKKFDKEEDKKMIHRFAPMANQAFVASPKLSPIIHSAIRTAMLDPAFAEAGKKLLETYASPGFVEAKPHLYKNQYLYLKSDYSLGEEVERSLQPDVATR